MADHVIVGWVLLIVGWVLLIVGWVLRTQLEKSR
jgi:uncharacterized membrane protein